MYWLKLGSQRYPIRDGETTVGRNRYCTIVVDSPEASREHASIAHKDGMLVLTDLGSRNGTLLNGEPVVAPAALKPGDFIAIGSESLEVMELNNIPQDVISTVDRDPAVGQRPTLSAEDDTETEDLGRTWPKDD